MPENKLKNIAIFASGNGSNFKAIADSIKQRKIKASLKLLVCDNPRAYVLERARSYGVKTLLIRRRDYSTKKEYEVEILKNLKALDIGLVVLAGYMRMVGLDIVMEYKWRLINIHPAILPSFKGTQAIKDAFDYGVKVTGVTVHFVDEDMDTGPIILQEAVKISGKDTLESLENKIHRIEHKLYPKAIQLILAGKLSLKGRKVLDRG